MKIKKYFLLLLLFFSSTVFADHVDVEANPPSGIYNTPIHIELTTTEFGAKTFYSFKPDGYPQDAYLYIKPVLLKKSSPFVFFSIISPTNESKIKQNDYTIEYSPSIRFSSREVTTNPSGSVDISIENGSNKDINIGFWQIQSEISTKEIPEGTILSPGTNYSLSLAYTGSSPVVLRSPDGEERDILQIKKVEILPIQKIVSPGTKTIIPQEEKINTQNPQNTPSPDTDKTTSTGETIIIPVDNTSEPVVAVPTEIISTPMQSSNISSGNESTQQDIGVSIKTSVSESGGNTIHPLYIFILLSVSILLGFGQFWYRRKKKG